MRLCIIAALSVHVFSVAAKLSLPTPALPKPPGIPMVDMGPEAQVLRRDVPPYDTVYNFTQWIDHSDKSKGTFQQRYWHTAEFYEEGGPIVFMNAGEVNAAPYNGYVTNRTINGVLAQRYHGAAVVLEHRFFGLSNPYPNLNTESLELLTVAQTIEDHVYFAQNVVLPQPNGDQVGPDKAPWVMIGGSYPGALVSWTMAAHPGVFWIGYSSSGTVESQIDFWQYYEPIRQNMPRNCSADIEAVITHVDEVFSSTNTSAQTELRNVFGVGTADNAYLANALRWDLWSWQSMQPNTVPEATFYVFCDALEVKNGVSATSLGWGLDHALAAWGSYWKKTYLGVDDACLELAADATACISDPQPPSPAAVRAIPNPRHESPPIVKRADVPVDDSGRSWFWLVCNEIGFSQTGPPIGQGGIVSRFSTWQDYLSGCVDSFPEKFSTYPIPPVEEQIKLYGGWGVKNDRLFFANGKRDPWREGTVSALNSTAVSTERQPIEISNGFHATDLVMALAAPDQSIVDVQNSFLEYAGVWLEEFFQ